MAKKNITNKNDKVFMIIFGVVLSIIIILIIVFITYLFSPKRIIQFSELKYEDDYIVGKIKNTDTSNAYDITIHFIYKSGNLEEHGVCYEQLDAGETKQLECLEFDIDETYTIKVDDIDIEKINQ